MMDFIRKNEVLHWIVFSVFAAHGFVIALALLAPIVIGLLGIVMGIF